MQHPLVFRRLQLHTNADLRHDYFLTVTFQNFSSTKQRQAIRRCRPCDSCIDDIQYVAMPHCIRVFNIIHVCLYKGITENSVTWYVILEDVSYSAISVASCSAHTQKKSLVIYTRHVWLIRLWWEEVGEGQPSFFWLLRWTLVKISAQQFLTVNGWW